MHSLLGDKDKPGVNTICTSCKAFLGQEENADERFLFFSCLGIFDFFLWVRRKILSDRFVLEDSPDGTVIEHYLGVAGDKQDLPSLMAVWRPPYNETDDDETDSNDTNGNETDDDENDDDETEVDN